MSGVRPSLERSIGAGSTDGARDRLQASHRIGRFPAICYLAVCFLVVGAGIAGLAGTASAAAPLDPVGPVDAAPSAVGHDPGDRQFQTGPTANLTVRPDPAHPGDPVQLDATASTAPGDDDIVRCEFDVDGDGAPDVTSQDCLAEVTYDALGDRSVSVRVVAESGGTATDAVTVTVAENEPPRPVIDVEPSAPRPAEELTVSAANSRDADGEVVEYIWTIERGVQTGETAATRFEAAGTYQVGLVVRDDDGAENGTTTTVEVREDGELRAALDASPVEPGIGEAVTLDAGASSHPSGRIASYRWDVDGDGEADRTTAESRTTVTFEEPGSVAVTVTVVDERGQTASSTTEVAVGQGADGPTAAPGGGSDGTGPAPDGAESGLLAPLDPGLVPFLPDWLVLLALFVAVGAVGVGLRRRDALAERGQRLRERVRRGDVRRRLARKASGFFSKSILKQVLRRTADAVELSGRTIGEGFERFGGWLKRGSKRIADALRSIGG